LYGDWFEYPYARSFPRNMRRIAAVTFDLWDTLIQEKPGGSDKVAALRIDRICKYLNDKGMVHTKGEVATAYRKSGDFLEMTWSKRRDMPVRDQVLFILSSIDSRLTGKLSEADLQNIEKVYSNGILEHPPILLPDAREVLKAVRSRGYKLGLISNTGRTPGTVLRILMGNMGILDYFDATTFSNEILVRKPSEGAFTFTLEKLKVIPRAAVHVGDDPESDIAGAKRVGMRAVQIISNGMRPSGSADDSTKSLDQIPQMIDNL
jgi:HAD superfamily hydrolase (TIGR01509 family)